MGLCGEAWQVCVWLLDWCLCWLLHWGPVHDCRSLDRFDCFALPTLTLSFDYPHSFSRPPSFFLLTLTLSPTHPHYMLHPQMAVSEGKHERSLQEVGVSSLIRVEGSTAASKAPIGCFASISLKLNCIAQTSLTSIAMTIKPWLW